MTIATTATTSTFSTIIIIVVKIIIIITIIIFIIISIINIMIIIIVIIVKVLTQNVVSMLTEKPTFRQMPDDVMAKEDDTIELKCSATGDPQPAILWQKESGEIPFGR